MTLDEIQAAGLAVPVQAALFAAGGIGARLDAVSWESPWWEWLAARLFGRRIRATQCDTRGTCVVEMVKWRGKCYVESVEWSKELTLDFTPITIQVEPLP